MLLGFSIFCHLGGASQQNPRLCFVSFKLFFIYLYLSLLFGVILFDLIRRRCCLLFLYLGSSLLAFLRKCYFIVENVCFFG